MKKLLGVIVIVVAIAAGILFSCSGIGFGSGLGLGVRSNNGDGDNRSGINTNAEQEEAAETNGTVESATDEQENKEIIIKVSVVENDYFYENEKIDLNSLLQVIKKTEGNYVVEVKDEQASKNAYEALINALSDNGIVYAER